MMVQARKQVILANVASHATRLVGLTAESFKRLHWRPQSPTIM